MSIIESPPSYATQAPVTTTPSGEAEVLHPDDKSGEVHRIWVKLEPNYRAHVNLSKLKECAAAAEAIFTIPESKPELVHKEGTKQNPVLLRGVDAGKFIAFNNWFNERNWETIYHSKQTLLGILEISHWLQFDGGVQWAANELDKLKVPDGQAMDTGDDGNLVTLPTQANEAAMADTPLTPAHRLNLAAKYQISRWILPAINEIFDQQEKRKQLRLLTSEDTTLMGHPVFELIAKGLEAVMAARISVSINCPDALHSVTCPNKYSSSAKACTDAWKRWWVSNIPQLVLNPKQPVPLHDLAGHLKGCKVPDVKAECVELTVAGFAVKPVLSMEKQIRDKVAAAIWDLYKH